VVLIACQVGWGGEEEGKIVQITWEAPSKRIAILLSSLQMYLETAVVQNSLEHSSSQIQKCHELYNTLLVRHGVMLLGPSGGGKSSVIRLLVTALNRCYADYYGPKSFHAFSTEPSSIVVGSMSQVCLHLVYRGLLYSRPSII
jgi:hypothetical protein